MCRHLILPALLSFSTLVAAQNITCPTTPTPFPAASTFPKVSTLPDPFTYLDGTTRVKSKDEWYACRQPEIVRMLQNYFYGTYPDHGQEQVSSVRTGNSLAITVVAGGKTAKFSAAINLPTGASTSAPVPVVIAIGGIDNNAYLKQGIAVVTFDYSSVAADSNSKTGAFWSLYNGRDIGMESIPRPFPC